MRLPDLINRFRRRISESTNFVRHPTQVLSQKGRRRLQVWYENVNLPGSQKAKQTARQVKAPPPAADFFTQFQDGPATASAQAVTASSTAVAVAPVSPPSPAPTIQDQRSLRPEEKLQGVWGGRYRVGEWRRSDVGLDLYEGIQEYSGEPVWIFVYHLSSEIFSRSEMVARRQAFEQLLSVNLKLGHDRDFRLIKLVDAFVDHQQDDRCYLVTKPLPNACTLADHLEKYPYGLTAFQVRQVLYQVLQSLKYLHSAYRVYWPGETSEQCLYHGNLSLDSLWIRMANRHTATGEVQFFIYLSRFALWEHLFLPLQGRLLPTAIATHARDLGSPEADLRDLGWVAFSLLTGQKVDPQKVTLIEPQNAQYWPADPQTQVLKPYIWRLMGIGDEEPFKSVDTAKAALDRLPLTPPPDPVADIPPPAVSEPITERRQARLWLLAILLVLGLAGLVAWRWLRQSETVIELLNPCPEGSCELSDIPVLSQATSQYAVEFGSAWGKAINRSLMSPLVPRSDDPFEHALEARYNEEAEGQPLSLRRESLTKTEQRNERVALFRQLEQGKLDFALMRLSDDLPETLNFDVVAFDAIAIFVAFSDANRAESTPQRLQGQIRLNRLRDILTSQTLPNESMPYKIYAPVADAASGTDESAAAELKATLFENPEQQARFEQWIRLSRAEALTVPEDRRNDVYARLLDAFESQSDGAIGLGFDRFSNMMGQCSVYPLTIGRRTARFSLLTQANGQPVSPDTDLCGDKGSYWANSAAFPTQEIDGKVRLDDARAYPFATELAVVYPQCEIETEEAETPCNPGQAFAQILKTVEGQYLLSEVGLIPVMPIDEIRNILWAGGTDD